MERLILIPSAILIYFLLILGCESSPKESDQNIETMEVYEVNKAEVPILINGRGDHEQWDKANVLKKFELYWNEEAALPTSFKALHDDQNLYLSYYAEDPNLANKLDTLRRIEAVQSDRVEIFFKGSNDQEPYYSLEMDCYGRLFDSEGKFGEYINADWNWPEGHLDIKTNIGKNHYTLEARISKESLERLGLLNYQSIKAGVYRADYVLKEDGTREPKWISWIDPKTPKPNFHIGTSFGTFLLK